MHVMSKRQAVIISRLIFVGGLIFMFPLHLLACLLAGLLVFELVNALTLPLQRLIPGERARWLAVALLGACIVSLLALLAIMGISAVSHELRNPGTFLNNAMDIINQARQQLPASIVARLPGSAEEVQQTLKELLHQHVHDLQLMGKGALHIFVTLLLGMIIGAIVALQRPPMPKTMTPFTSALLQRVILLRRAFHNIVFAQLKISLVNTALTTLFLLVVLPIFGVHLPLAKTLVIFTFIVGLLPIIGNLISNTLICILALSLSFWVSLATLGYLIAIHKVEYFLNARIVGNQIKARSWELLVAMLVFEATFGLGGLIAAPIYYAYIKSELKSDGLV